MGIISKVAAAEFSTTPIVPVLKPNGQVRICKDFKVTVNRYLDLTHYPLPDIKEMFERLSGEAVYLKLYLPDAYLQVELDKESKWHVVITTHKGLYRYNRLCFGIASAPAITHGIIEQILQPVKGVQPYLDDIALKGINNQDLLKILRQTFSTLRQAGVKLKREKCVNAQVNQISWTCSRRLRFAARPRQSRGILKAPQPQNRIPRATGELSRHGAILWVTRP